MSTHNIASINNAQNPQNDFIPSHLSSENELNQSNSANNPVGIFVKLIDHSVTSLQVIN